MNEANVRVDERVRKRVPRITSLERFTKCIATLSDELVQRRRARFRGAWRRIPPDYIRVVPQEGVVTVRTSYGQ